MLISVVVEVEVEVVGGVDEALVEVTVEMEVVGDVVEEVVEMEVLVVPLEVFVAMNLEIVAIPSFSICFWILHALRVLAFLVEARTT